MLPTQILWINLVATVALALPLAFEAMEPDVMRRPPRQPGAPIMNRFVVVRTLIVSLLMTAGAIGLFLYEFYGELHRIEAAGQAHAAAREQAYRVAQTMAVTTVVLFQIFYLLNCRSLRDSIFRIGLFSNPLVYLGILALIVLQAGFIYLPFMNRAFGSAPLSPFEVGKALALALTVLPVIGLEKWIRARRAAP
jgi:Ca2+-transporting ATPase